MIQANFPYSYGDEGPETSFFEDRNKLRVIATCAIVIAGAPSEIALAEGVVPAAKKVIPADAGKKLACVSAGMCLTTIVSGNVPGFIMCGCGMIIGTCFWLL